MKTVKPESSRHWYSDDDRARVIRLFDAGLSATEVADTLKISKSVVYFIKQAHTACIKQDWSTLQKLSITHRSTVDWAMRFTGTDKIFAEFEKTPEKDVEPAVEPVNNPNAITREDFLSLQNTLQDICYLLTEIRDALK